MRLSWVWLELYFTPKRNDLKWNRLDYQLLFRKETWTCTGRLDWNPQKSSLKRKYMSKGAVFSTSAPTRYFWLFLPKHKLELMFSSIEPYAPCRRYLPGNLFPALRTTNTYSHHPLFLPANEKIACTCSQNASQSALHSLSTFTLEIPILPITTKTHNNWSYISNHAGTEIWVSNYQIPMSVKPKWSKIDITLQSQQLS